MRQAVGRHQRWSLLSRRSFPTCPTTGERTLCLSSSFCGMHVSLHVSMHVCRRSLTGAKCCPLNAVALIAARFDKNLVEPGGLNNILFEEEDLKRMGFM